MGVDTMGGAASTFLAGVPVGAGNTTTPGSIIGENLHAIITAELAVHAHANSLNDPTHSHNITHNSNNLTGASGVIVDVCFANGGNSANWGNTVGAATGMSINNANAGSGTAHNTVQRSITCFWGQKL